MADETTNEPGQTTQPPAPRRRVTVPRSAPAAAPPQAGAPVLPTPRVQSSSRTVEDEAVEFDLGVAKVAPQLPKLPADSQFLWLYHPARWMVVEGHVVPVLVTLQLKPGVSNVDYDERNKRILARDAISRKEDTGHVLIRPEWAPDGKTYVRRVAVAGGFAHISCFTKARPGTDRLESDVKGYAGWLSGLFTSGKLPAPPVDVIETLRETMHSRMLRTSEIAVRAPARAEHVTRLVKDIEAIDAFLAKLTAGAGPVDGTLPPTEFDLDAEPAGDSRD